MQQRCATATKRVAWAGRHRASRDQAGAVLNPPAYAASG
jgi:hypothetical protein